MAHLDDLPPPLAREVVVFDELRTAELNVVYYKSLAKRYTRRCVVGAVALTLAVSASALGFTEGLVPFRVTGVVLVGSAVMIWVLAEWKQRMELCLWLEFEWLKLAIDWELLRRFGRVDDRVVSVYARRAALLHAEDLYPEDLAEARRAQAEVERQHGAG